MDGKRFDRLARQWSISASRRRLVRAAGAATLGGLVNRLSSEELSAGITLVPGRVAAAEECRIKKVTLWINAFLPNEVFNADGSLYTSEVPDGQHQGETMVPGPTGLNDCFLTDQRLFSDAIAAPSRMHSEITINVKTGKVIDQKHRCSPTHEVDCEDGAVECAATGKVKGRRFYDFRATGGREFTVFLRAAASNPCFTGSPDIDYEGRFRIELNGKKNKATVLFKGKVDAFPAFEAYASVNGGAPKPLFQLLPPPGNTPADLPGRASVPVSGSAVFEEECKTCPPGREACGTRCCPAGASCLDLATGTCSLCGSGQSPCGSNPCFICIDGQCRQRCAGSTVSDCRIAGNWYICCNDGACSYKPAD